jgi:hypothetical protein
MDDNGTRQSVLFSDLCHRPVVAKFDQQHGSSDGGAILLKACDERQASPCARASVHSSPILLRRLTVSSYRAVLARALVRI